MSDLIIRKARHRLEAEVARSSLSASSKLVFKTLLFEFYNISDGRCFPTDRQIKEKTGLSTKTIERARAILVRECWIEVFVRRQDKRRRNYRFPKLDSAVQSARNAANPKQENQTFCPKDSDKMSGTSICNRTTNKKKNTRSTAPLGRSPVLVDGAEHLAWDQVLETENLPSLGLIFSPVIFDGKPVFWLRKGKPPKSGTIDYNLEVNWIRDQLNKSKINQKAVKNE